MHTDTQTEDTQLWIHSNVGWTLANDAHEIPHPFLIDHILSISKLRQPNWILKSLKVTTMGQEKRTGVSAA